MAKHDWHLDKKIPIAFLAAFLIYGIGAIIYAAKLDDKVGDCQIQVSEIKKTLEERGRIGESYFVRLDRLEVRFDGFEKSQADMATNIKLIMERQYNENNHRK